MAKTHAPHRTLWQRVWSLFDANEKYLKGIWPQVAKINALEPEFETLTQQDLQDRLRKIRSRVAKAREEVLATQVHLPPAGDTETRRLREKEVVKAEKAILDEHLPEVFAAVREAAKRTLSMRHFDVQMLGGIVLHEGRISEMKTGEGKTLTATCPLVLNALAGRGAHLVTVNDYLARRDAEWMGKIYRYLGLTVGVIQHDLDRNERQHSYGCDITYITNHEIGFDYLRDHSSAWRPEHLVIRELYYAIIDEVDSILIDEARVPLIISASRGKPVEKYRKVQEVVTRLVVGTEDIETKATTGDVIVDEKTKNATLTEDGQRKVEIGLGIDNLNDSAHIEDMHLVSSALKANYCYKRDIDYIVGPADGGILGVIIVDTFTGRPQPGRRWSDGLHQAIEAKERVQIQDEQQTIATVTYQNFFLMYQKLSGMTGTAKTEEAEFVGIYEMPVAVVPTNRPMIRLEHSDIVYKNEEWKFRGICCEIVQYYCRRQPVLVGTRSVETSERISARLKPDMLRMSLQFCLFQDYLMAHEKKLGKELCRELRGRSTPPLELWKPRDVATMLTDVGLDPVLDKPENVKLLAEILQIKDEAALLDVIRNGVPHEVLNARYHEREAQIVAQAGRLGAITIATNMAGRGTDIVLGGNPEPDIEDALARRGIDPKSLQATLFINAALKGDPEAARTMAAEQGGLPQPVLDEIASIRAAWQAEHEDVVAVGGLHILGTERLESRRIDNQLRGRSGRQGDPGGARFYVSLQDELMRLFGPERWGLLMNQWPDEQPVEAKIISKSMNNAQKKVESRNFDMRKNTLRYDDVMNVQRLHIYAERGRILQGVDLRSTVSRMMGEMVGEVINESIASDKEITELELEEIWSQLNGRFPLKDQMAFDDLRGISREALTERLEVAADRSYDDKENDFIRAIVEFELAASIHETLSQVTDRAAVVMVLNALWPLTAYLPDRLEGVGDSKVPEVLFAVAREALEERPKQFISAVMSGRLASAVDAAVEAIVNGTVPDEALNALRLDWPLDFTRELAGKSSPAQIAEALPQAAASALERGGWHFVQEALRRQMDRSVDEWLPVTCHLEALLADLDRMWPLPGLNARQMEQFNYTVIEDKLRRAGEDAVTAGGLSFLDKAALHRFHRTAELAVAEVGEDPYTLATRLSALLPPRRGLTGDQLSGDLKAALYAVESEMSEDLTEALVLSAIEEVVARAVEDAHRHMAAGVDEGDAEESLEAGDLQSLVARLNTEWALGDALDPWALERLNPGEMRREMIGCARGRVRAQGSAFVVETARLRLDRAIVQAIGEHYSLPGLCRRLNEHFELPAVFEAEAMAECTTPAELIAALTEVATEAFSDDETAERMQDFQRQVRTWVDEGWNLKRLCERLNAEYRPTPKLDAKELAGLSDDELAAELTERLAPAEDAWRDAFVLDAVRQHVQITIDETLATYFDVRQLSQRVGELWPVRPDAVRASKLKGWPYNELGKRLKDALHAACRAEEWRFIRRFVLRHMEDGLRDAMDLYTPGNVRRNEFNLAGLCDEIRSRWPLDRELAPRELEAMNHQQIVDYLLGEARRLYAERERAFIRETAAHRFGLQLDNAVAQHYSLDRAAAEVNERWGIGQALSAHDLARLRTLLAGDARAALAEIRRLTEPVLTEAEASLQRDALDRRIIDSVDDVLRRHYNTSRLVTALLGQWPLTEGNVAELSSGALRGVAYKDMVDRVRGVMTGADGALRRRLVFHNLRATVDELDLATLVPSGQPGQWQLAELLRAWNASLPYADAVDLPTFGARLLGAALDEEIEQAASARAGAAAFDRAVEARVADDMLELTRVERRPQTLYERLAQRWPVTTDQNPDSWRGKNLDELKKLLTGCVLGALAGDRAQFVKRAVALWIERSVREAMDAFWPESGEPGPWVLAQVCQNLNRRWRREDLLHPSNFKQLGRDELVGKLLAVGEALDPLDRESAFSAELVGAHLRAAVAGVARTASSWEAEALATALGKVWTGATPVTAARLREQLTTDLVRGELLLLAEGLEQRVNADYGTEALQGWLTSRMESALSAHCSLVQVCAELAQRWPIGELDDSRLAVGNYEQVREALRAYVVEAAHHGGTEFAEQTARLRLEADLAAGDAAAVRERWALAPGGDPASVDLLRSFGQETMRRWLRQSVRAEQSTSCNPEIAADRWDAQAFVDALERDWPIAGLLSADELGGLGAGDLYDQALGVLRAAFDGHETEFVRETTRQRLVHSVRDAIGEYASLERLAGSLNEHWPRDTRTTAQAIATERIGELALVVAEQLARQGIETDEAELRRVIDRIQPSGVGGPEELEPVAQQITSHWPELGEVEPYLLDEKLVSEALRARLWTEFQEEPRAFVKAVALEDVPRQLERRLMLEAIDTNWCNHLEAMDYLREGIGLRGYAQTDPFIAYRKEGRQMFDNMLGRVAETVVMGLFETTDEELTEMHRYGRLGLQISVNYQNVQELAAKAEELTGSQTPAPQPMAPRQSAGGGGSRRPSSSKRSGPSLEEPAAAKTVTVDKVGRNDPCPCGSGKKYKVCCGRG